MSYAGTVPGFALDHRAGFALSVIGHVAVVFALSTSLIFAPSQPLPQLAIEATIVDEGAIKRIEAAAEQVRRDQAAQRRQEEQQRAEQVRKQQAELERKEQQRQKDTAAEAERQRVAEQQRADQTRQAEERARIEQQQREAKQRAAEERKQREAAARAEADRQRMLAEAEREDQQRREAEMRSSMEEEEALLAARQSGEMSRYLAFIQQKVERNWTKPASAIVGLECEVAVVQLPNGDVIDVRTVRCNGDDAVRRSIENAVRRSSPLPLPENRVLFDRNLSFVFRPE